MPRFETGGASLHYEIAGSGWPALVLTHGGGCTHRDWQRQVAGLAESCTVLTPDLRCHGQSGGSLDSLTIERWATDINALVDALGLAPALYVGHSLASRIAAEAVWQKPANATGLILLDGSRSLGGFAAKAPDVPSPVPAQAPSLTAVINAIVGPYADDSVRAHVQQTMSAHSMELLQASVAAYNDWDTNRADIVFPALKLPVLAIQSTYHDQFTPRRSLASEQESTPYLDFLRQALPRLQTVVLPKTGHFSMLERPETITALIHDFGKRTMGEQT